MSKRIAILGSTGSIGQNAFRVVQALPEEYEIAALTAHNNVKLLAEQVRASQARYAAVTNPECVHEFLELAGGCETEIITGPKALEIVAELEEVDIVVVAVVGAAGLPAVLSAAKQSKRIALANKEPLVIAGKVVTDAAARYGAEIIPVDSEHSAIFQAVQAGGRESVSKIILTASGGALRDMSSGEIENVSVAEVLAHPVWQMGRKITVDSASMVNKALEVIEARWLFDVAPEQIEVVIHPESVVHSMVEFADASIIAQMGAADMKLPIQYAITFPERLPGLTEKLRLSEIGRLTFEKPDFDKFRALRLGFQAAKAGGTVAAVFNAANEAAVERFLAGKIKFVSIVELIEHCLNKHSGKEDASLDELLEADGWARKEVQRQVKKTAALRL